MTTTACASPASQAPDVLALLDSFLSERCTDWRSEVRSGSTESRGHHQPIRALGQVWQAWLLLHGVRLAQRRQWNTRWLKERLIERGYRIANSHGKIVICDLTLTGRRPLLAGDDGQPIPAERLQNSLLLGEGRIGDGSNGGMGGLSPDLAQHIPLAGATAAHRPPDDEIVRRFLDACCDCEPVKPRLAPATGYGSHRPRSPYTTRVLFTLLARAFNQWLTAQGAAPSLLRLCSSQWLKRALVARGYALVRGEHNFVYATGVTLAPAVALTLPERPRRTKAGADDDGAAGSTARATKADLLVRRQRRLAQKEYEARLRTGFPAHVAREALSLDLTPEPATVVARRAREQAQERLRQAAQRYVNACLVYDGTTTLAWPSLTGFFRAFLLNEHVPANGASVILLGVLTESGATVERGKQHQVLKVVGYRYRTPKDTR